MIKKQLMVMMTAVGLLFAAGGAHAGAKTDLGKLTKLYKKADKAGYGGDELAKDLGKGLQKPKVWEQMGKNMVPVGKSTPGAFKHTAKASKKSVKKAAKSVKKAFKKL